MKQTPKQSGFSAVILLLVLVIIGIIGGTGWYVWNRQQNTKTNNSGNAAAPVAPKESQNNGKSSVKYVTIKEWNVRAPYSGDVEFTYKIEGNSAANFTSGKVAKLGHGCTDGFVGTVGRYKTGENFAYDGDGSDSPERSVEEVAKEDTNFVKVGNDYYRYFSPQSTCAIENGSIHEETAKAQESASNELKALVSKLEEVK